MRILITGGTGFIGGRLAVHLASQGHEVSVASRSIPTTLPWGRDISVKQIDWSSDSSVQEICHGMDVVIHAAGMNAGDCLARPSDALYINGACTKKIVAGAVGEGVHKIIYMSTAHVYNSPLTGEISENTVPRNQHPYATSHLAGERAVLAACMAGSIAGIILRVSNAFGAPVHKDVNCWMLLVNDLCRQLVTTGKALLATNGKQSRNFVPMRDLCKAVEHLTGAFQYNRSSPVYNIGSSLSITVLDMARLVLSAAKSTSSQDFKMEINVADCDSGESYLNYSVEKLKDAGFRADINSSSEEIADLIRFCKAVF